VGRAPSARRLRQEQLIGQIRQAHEQSDGTYGSPRVHAELVGQEVEVCVNTVAKLMKQARIRSVMHWQFVVRTTDMSRAGDCYDNAAMESFWGTLKTELVYHRDYQTREEARQSTFTYIECWCNRRRRHSAIAVERVGGGRHPPDPADAGPFACAGCRGACAIRDPKR
jgi:transposase InsO family protein